MSESIENLLNRLIGATILEAQSAYPSLEPTMVEQTVLDVMRRDLKKLKEGDKPDSIASEALTEITKQLDEKLSASLN